MSSVIVNYAMFVIKFVVLSSREIEHQNLLKVFGQCIETLPYLVVLELCPFVSIQVIFHIAILCLLKLV